MAKRPNLGQISNPVFSVSQLNEAFSKIDTAFDNTLSRDGSTPNTMLADLDMNSNDILNVGVLDGDQINVNEAYIGGKLFTGTLTWRSDWLTVTSYQELDLVKQNGTVYVCLEEHTSGVFATDLSGGKWEIFVEASGGGGGGVTDHGDLTGLSDDDHTQYHNDTRGDARYYTQAQVDSSLSGKANTSHTHSISDVTGTKAEFDTAVTDGNIVYTDAIGVSVQAYDADTAKTDVAQNFTAAQGSTPVALTDNTNISTDASLSNVFTVTLGGNRTLDNPTNLVAGRTYCWVITQDGSGGHTLAYGNAFDFPGGTAPTLSTGAGDVDLIAGIAISTSRLLCVANLDFS